MPYPGSVALGIFGLGIAAAILSNFAGARTAQGSVAAQEGVEFERFLTFGTPALTEGEHAGVFARYLPYALVQGVADDWARVCDGLDDPAVMADVLDWYRIPAWTIEQVSDVSTSDFTDAVGEFYRHTARIIGSSKAESQRRR